MFHHFQLAVGLFYFEREERSRKSIVINLPVRLSQQFSFCAVAGS